MTLEQRESGLGLDANIALKVPSQKQIKQERALQLLYTLHASLHLDAIMQHFSQAVNLEVSCDLHYDHPDTDTHFETGAVTEHELKYNLSLNDAQLGEMNFYKTSPFTENEAIKLEDLLLLLLQPLRNAILHEYALRGALFDPLTGLYNRMNLDEVLKREIHIARRHANDFSLVALDIDYFKSINDNYGHMAGDQYLKAFADAIKCTVRDSDTVYRTGGEEFLIICPNTNSQGANLLAERLRTTLAALICEHRGQTIQTSASIGLCSFHEHDDHQSLLERADKALYQAKHAGRNCVRSLD